MADIWLILMGIALFVFIVFVTASRCRSGGASPCGEGDSDAEEVTGEEELQAVPEEEEVNDDGELSYTSEEEEEKGDMPSGAAMKEETVEERFMRRRRAQYDALAEASNSTEEDLSMNAHEDATINSIIQLSKQSRMAERGSVEAQAAIEELHNMLNTYETQEVQVSGAGEEGEGVTEHTTANLFFTAEEEEEQRAAKRRRMGGNTNDDEYALGRRIMELVDQRPDKAQELQEAVGSMGLKRPSNSQLRAMNHKRRSHFIEEAIERDMVENEYADSWKKRRRNGQMVEDTA